ncbi:MAG: TonB-dependent receptor [Bacteroidota bacterium]
MTGRSINLFYLILAISLVSSVTINAQKITQTIKGVVYDIESNNPLYGASIIILETNPITGTITDSEGRFKIDSVTVGRYNLLVSYIGYQSYYIREIIVGSGKEVVLNIELKESVNELEQVVVEAHSNKSNAINSMTTLSAKQISIEEANRYAGGFDDPARLVSSYAGVAYNVGNNGIIIRGNSPKGLLWKMEGVQIPNPNHFADYISLGGGAVTALSSNTMASSDFFTGAFPAEYGNALAGVFDINLRNGNVDKREHTFQASFIGIDFASEGPFRKGKRSTYLFNYRYSTLGLLSPILPKEMGKLTYQDLSFKFNFPTKVGVFSFWGIGAYDYQGKEPLSDSTKWENSNDRKEYITILTMFATGLNYNKIINSRTYFKSTIALTENSFVWSQKRYDDDLNLMPKRTLDDYRWKYSFSGFLNHKFNSKHTNRTGYIINRLMYDIDLKNAAEYGDPLVSYVSERGGSNLIQFYSQSKINFSDKLVLNAGVHSQYFALNDNYTIEPRIGLRWKFSPHQTISFAYGLHSQLEIIHLYLIEQVTANGIVLPNKNLDFAKAHHYVFGYEFQIKENLNIKIEPYYQHLYDIPVVPNSYLSTINMTDIWNFNDSLINKGTGKNIGFDLTLERYLSNGYYYLFTASLFDSKYKGGDNIERNTKYNKNYVFNILYGKEWKIGRDNKNLLNVNFRMSYMGGDRIVPINVNETMNHKEIIEDINRAYEQKLKDAPILSLSFSYRRNKPEHSSIWSLHIINALCHKDFQEYEFNEEEGKIEKIEDLLVIPNISYKIEF